ncbi:hypothetical protein Agub_g15328 [Astrephomene gubernaculifera]|uniref:Uncharacterized protein n=1 Tax=Astrephomene gubernaculifera TaxID=47775 RepID=A0AAD3HTT2_9CHLO|nr:hypothetical protein Agub_g15328 [Astrephomene gubernaculifera]
MAHSAQPVGLAMLLNWGDGSLHLGQDKLAIAAAAATAAAASPLLRISYGSKGVAALGRAAAAVAAPLTAYALQPSYFAASALAPAVDVDNGSPAGAKPLPELKSILSLYRPLSLSKMLAKNLAMHLIIKFQRYMMEYAEHEQAAIAAEAQGQDVPEPPPFPDMTPAAWKGVYSFGRELAVATTRRVYEQIAAAKLPPARAQALLREARPWIRDVLAAKHRTSSLSRRFTAYQFATLHSSVLFYAADCTVAVLQHTHRTWKRKDKTKWQKLTYWGRGVVLQVARCGIIWMVVSVGTAACSLVRPGIGTQIGNLGTEIPAAIIMSYVVETLLEY